MTQTTLGVVFDCDSTLSSIEGIDELAVLAGQGAAIKALTDAAMNGEVPLEAVYQKRLDLIRPNKALLHDIAEQYRQTVTPNALALIQHLQAQGVKVAIVSGGLEAAILPLAQDLGIETVFAVPLEFDAHGNYLATPAHPLTTAHGKSQVIQAWRESLGLTRVVMIGDGMSDVAAKPAADVVIGYGGVVVRPAVQAAADVFSDQPDMLALLPLIQSALAG